MSNSTTHFLHQHCLNTSNADSVAKRTQFCARWSILLVLLIISVLLIVITVLLSVTVVANALVLAEIWNPLSEHLLTYCSLVAFTDFCTGLISQPLWIPNELPRYLDLDQFYTSDKLPTSYSVTGSIGDGFAKYFYQMTVLLVTFMSIEHRAGSCP